MLDNHPQREVTVVVLGKYADIFAGFKESAERFLGNYPRILVRDGNEIPDPGVGWKLVQGPEKFSMAGNANLGWRAVHPEHDILYTSDDVRFTHVCPVERLRLAAYTNPKIGILSPLIHGAACNKLQTYTPLTHTTETQEPLAFICVYIKRELIEKIGMLDEEFDEYGYDDVDYCRRAIKDGFTMAVTPAVKIIHWDDAHATFKRNPVWSLEKNRETFKRKWGET
jgi:hypothetical protein